MCSPSARLAQPFQSIRLRRVLGFLTSLVLVELLADAASQATRSRLWQSTMGANSVARYSQAISKNWKQNPQ